MELQDLPVPPAENTGDPEGWLARHAYDNKAEQDGWFEQAYRFLRADVGMRPKVSFYAAWLSVSKDDRGQLKTHEDVGTFLGVSRKTLYSWRSKHKLDGWAEQLRILRMRGDRLAEVDAQVYATAISPEGKSTDRRLFYERAGVLNDANLEEQRNQDQVTKLLVELKSVGEFEER